MFLKCIGNIFAFCSQAEAIPESLKNMLLVMDTAGVFECPEDGSNSEKCQMWLITWDRINAFLPGLKEELFKQSTPPKAPEEVESTLDNKDTENTTKSNLLILSTRLHLCRRYFTLD